MPDSWKPRVAAIEAMAKEIDALRWHLPTECQSFLETMRKDRDAEGIAPARHR
jgi:hypothetical protein